MKEEREKVIQLIDDMYEAAYRMKEYNERVKNRSEGFLSIHMKKAFDDVTFYVNRLEKHIPKN